MPFITSFMVLGLDSPQLLQSDINDITSRPFMQPNLRHTPCTPQGEKGSKRPWYSSVPNKGTYFTIYAVKKNFKSSFICCIGYSVKQNRCLINNL